MNSVNQMKSTMILYLLIANISSSFVAKGSVDSICENTATGKNDQSVTFYGTGDSVIFDMSQSYQIASVVEVMVSFVSALPVYSLDFALQFNHQKASFDTLFPNSSNFQYLYFLNPLDSTLRFTSNSMVPLSGDSLRVAVSFHVFSGPLCSGDIYNIETFINGNPCDYSITNCQVTAIHEKDDSGSLVVYPVPSASRLNVQWPVPGSLTFFDLQGRKILETRHPGGNMVIEMTGWPPGIYVLSVSGDEGSFLNRMVIKM